MNLLVLIKPVPDPEHEKDIRIDAASGRLIREGIPQVIDPESRSALEAALQMAEKSGREQSAVYVLAMAPEHARDKLTEALAMGADEAFLLSDKVFGGADTYATSYMLAEAVRKMEEQKGFTFDLILAGTSSSDGGTSHVAVQVAEWLGRTHITNVCSLSASGETLRAVKRSEEVILTFEGEEPVVIGVTRDIAKPRFVTAMGIIKARKKPLTIWNGSDLGIDSSRTGLEGSPTRPGRLYEPDQARAGEVIGETPEDAAAGILQIIRKAGF